jgi:hypothetical protein
MNRPVAFALVFLLAASVAGGALAQEREDWLGRMSELSAALTRVFVNVLPEDKKRTKADDARLAQDAQKLAALAKAVHSLAPTPPGGVKGAGAAPDADPSLALIAKLFVDETDRMVKAIERGNTARARDLAAGTATFCIGCHTRSDRLRALVPAPAAADLSALHPLDRAELLIATHRFDDAKKELDALLANDRFAMEDVVGWRRAVTRALVLEVRTARSPDGALALVERVLNGPVPAVQNWADADGWRKSLKAWKAESGARPERPDAALREARRLLDEAEATPRVPGDRSADVLYLRATALLHDALAAEQAGPARARAFSLLAVSYRRLRDLGVWSLSRLYDEACVHQAPNTDLARECYERYAAEVNELDADKRGRLPAESAAHLKELAKIAGATIRSGG